MAEIEHIHFEDLTVRSTTSATFGTVSTLSSASLSASATYFVYVVVQLTCTDNVAGVGVQWRMQNDSVTVTHSECSWEVAFDNSYQTHSFAAIITTDASPGDIVFQLASIDGIQTARQDSLQVLMIRLDTDLTENTDYVQSENTTSTAHTTTFADFASVAIPQDASAAKDWLVLANIRTGVNDVAINFEGRIDFDAGTETAPFHTKEGEHANDIYCDSLMRVYSVASGGGTKTAKVQCRDDGTGTQNDHLRSFIFAINLTDTFAQHVSKWTEAETSATGADGLFDEIDTLDFTPTTASQNWAFIGQVIFDQGGAGRPAYLRMQQGGTSVPAGRESSNRFAVNSRDTTEELVGEYLAYLPSVPASLQDIDIDIADNGVTAAIGEDRSYVAFSLELAAAGGGLPIALAFNNLARGNQ